MSKRSWIILILVSLSLTLVAWQLLGPKEPHYGGKSLSEWILPSGKWETVSAAFAYQDELKVALHAMGDRTIPLLTKRLRWKPSPSLLALNRNFPSIRFLGELVKRARDRDPRAAAARALGYLGPQAQTALPELESLIGNQSDPFYLSYLTHVQFALLSIRQDSLTPYIEKLRDTSNLEWWEAARIVQHFGTNAVAAVPYLVAALEPATNVHYVRLYACNALASIHSRPELCVPALARLLKSSDSNLRGISVFALTAFGSSATSAWPALVECLQDPDPEIRGMATNLLKIIDSDAAAKAGAR